MSLCGELALKEVMDLSLDRMRDEWNTLTPRCKLQEAPCKSVTNCSRLLGKMNASEQEENRRFKQVSYSETISYSRNT